MDFLRFHQSLEEEAGPAAHFHQTRESVSVTGLPGGGRGSHKFSINTLVASLLFPFYGIFKISEGLSVTIRLSLPTMFVNKLAPVSVTSLDTGEQEKQ